MMSHLIGSLMKSFGPDRTLWGTDCLWWGSPQWIIQAMHRLIALHATEDSPSAVESRNRCLPGLEFRELVDDTTVSKSDSRISFAPASSPGRLKTYEGCK